MSVKPTSKSSCCSCFGSKEEEPESPTPRHHHIHRQERFHSYRPTDVNQMIGQAVDVKARKEADIAADVFKKTEKAT